MLKRWSSAFKTENCVDPDRFTSCRRYLITSYVQFQGCTNNLSIIRTQGPETKLPEPRGAPPHGTPRLAWSPMWVSGYAPAFLPLVKHEYKLFPIQEPTNLPGLLVPNGSKRPGSITWSKVKTTNGPYQNNSNGQNYISSFCPQLLKQAIFLVKVSTRLP